MLITLDLNELPPLLRTAMTSHLLEQLQPRFEIIQPAADLSPRAAQAAAIFDAVAEHGIESGYDWGALLLELAAAAKDGAQLSRSKAREIASHGDPNLAKNAVRAFGTTLTKAAQDAGWDSNPYIATYIDDFGGIKTIGITDDLAAALAEAFPATRD